MHVVEYRPFRNTDPPQLTEIWRTQPPQRGLMQPMSVATLERLVFSKPTFDRLGLIVAVEGDRLIGFAHAGFGPGDGGNTLSTDDGVVSLALVRPHTSPEVATQLISVCEAYLQSRGANVFFGGGHYPLAPFYYGLYGGSEISGVLESDVASNAIFQAAGYTDCEHSQVLRRDLAGFRPKVDRQQMQIRRQTTLEVVDDPPAGSWWEAVIFEPFERTLCYLQARDSRDRPASVHFWNMETMVGAWGVHAMGIVNLEVAGAKRRQGFASFLVGEALRQMHLRGVALAEVHVREDNPGAMRLFKGLGFESVDRATVYRKEAANRIT